MEIRGVFKGGGGGGVKRRITELNDITGIAGYQFGKWISTNYSYINFGCVVYNNDIYHIGGNISESDVNNKVTVFNTTDGSTTILLTDANLKRYSFGCVIIDDLIYMIGGRLTTGSLPIDSYTKTVYTYNITSETLDTTTETSMPIFKYDFGCTVVGDLIYCIGGKDETDTIVNSTQIYNTTTKSWSTLTYPMPLPKSNFGCYNDNNYIYCIGGLGTAPNYIFNISNNYWNDTGASWDLESSVYNNSCIKYNNNIWSIGGTTTAGIGSQYNIRRYLGNVGVKWENVGAIYSTSGVCLITSLTMWYVSDVLYKYYDGLVGWNRIAKINSSTITNNIYQAYRLVSDDNNIYIPIMFRNYSGSIVNYGIMRYDEIKNYFYDITAIPVKYIDSWINNLTWSAGVVVNDTIYFFYSTYIVKYNIIQNIWTDVINTHLNVACAITIGNLIYCIFRTDTANFAYYNTTDGNWYNLTDFPIALSSTIIPYQLLNHAGIIYLIISLNNMTSIIFMYDISLNAWNMVDTIAIPVAVIRGNNTCVMKDGEIHILDSGLHKIYNIASQLWRNDFSEIVKFSSVSGSGSMNTYPICCIMKNIMYMFGFGYYYSNIYAIGDTSFKYIANKSELSMTVSGAATIKCDKPVQWQGVTREANIPFNTTGFGKLNIIENSTSGTIDEEVETPVIIGTL
jgi:hypothetical protein